MPTEVRLVDPACPASFPAGFRPIRAPEELALLLEDNIHAVTLVPRDLDASQFFCEQLGSFACRRERRGRRLNKTAANVVRDPVVYYDHVLSLTGQPIQGWVWQDQAASPLAQDPRWQLVWQETQAITAQLAADHVLSRPPRVDFMNVHLATYLNGNLVARPHIDHGIKLIGTKAEQPSLVEFDRRLYSAPPYHYTFYKDTIRHRAPDFEVGISGCQRPRHVLTWDLEKPLKALYD